jgi:hypothetical protein
MKVKYRLFGAGKSSTPKTPILENKKVFTLPTRWKQSV